MTLVNAETGEIVEPLSRHDAERLTLRITYMAQSVADGIDKLLSLIGEARDGGAHLALGYGSWTAYVSAEFADILPRLDREPRRELVRELASSGMSTRAIAPVVHVHHDTVARDLRRVVDTTPETPEGGVTDAAEAADPGITAPRVPRPPVTGIDGKTYPAPKAVPAVAVPGDDDERAASVRRAAITNLRSVLTYLNPYSLTPAQMAEREYKAVLDEFDVADLNNAAAVMTAIADLKNQETH